MKNKLMIEAINQYLILNNSNNNDVFQQVKHMLISFFPKPDQLFFYLTNLYNNFIKFNNEQHSILTEFKMIINQSIFTFYHLFAKDIAESAPELKMPVFFFKLQNFMSMLSFHCKKPDNINLNIIVNISRELNQGFAFLFLVLYF